MDSCINRVFKEELGFEGENFHSSLALVSEDIDKDPRGHVIDLIYKIEVMDEVFTPVNDTKEIQFFKKLPDNIGFNHRDVLTGLGYNS